MLLLLLLVLIFLCESGGVTHWRIQEELIKAVNVNTVITAHQLSDTRDKDEEGKEVVVYDKELSILIKSVHTNKQGQYLCPSYCTPQLKYTIQMEYIYSNLFNEWQI